MFVLNSKYCDNQIDLYKAVKSIADASIYVGATESSPPPSPQHEETASYTSTQHSQEIGIL